MFGFLIPAITSIIGAVASKKAGDKAKKAAQLSPQTQGYQDAALRMQHERMQMLAPLYEQLLSGVSGRMAGAAPSIGQMRTPGTGQAISRLAQGLPGPAARRRRTQDQA